MEMKRTRSAGGIVIGDSGTIALVRNSRGDGSWLFPKGHLEAGEEDRGGEADRAAADDEDVDFAHGRDNA